MAQAPLAVQECDALHDPLSCCRVVQLRRLHHWTQLSYMLHERIGTCYRSAHGNLASCVHTSYDAIFGFSQPKAEAHSRRLPRFVTELSADHFLVSTPRWAQLEQPLDLFALSAPAERSGCLSSQPHRPRRSLFAASTLRPHRLQRLHQLPVCVVVRSQSVLSSSLHRPSSNRSPSVSNAQLTNPTASIRAPSPRRPPFLPSSLPPLSSPPPPSSFLSPPCRLPSRPPPPR